MLVRDQMTRNPVTVSQTTSVADALALMREKKIRRLVVAEGKDHAILVGIVSEKDLLYASPSPSTTLSVYEIPYLLAKLSVEKVMTRQVIAVEEDSPLEDAALIMADKKIGGLPVVKDGKLTGIITETDIFRTFLKLLGGRSRGVRATAFVASDKGTLAKITGAVSEAGGDIVGLGATEGATPSGAAKWELTLKVQGIARDRLAAVLKPLVTELVDIREV
jgi:acetoin utilization protein AcuB